MKYFAELPVMKSGKDISILKKMYDQMKKQYSELKSGLNAEKNNGLLLVHLFLEKLPAEICVNSRKFKSKIYDWTKILKISKMEIKAKE